MPFSWNPLPDVGDNVTPDKIIEIRGKVDTLCDDISISRPTWKTIDPHSHIETELEAQIDRVDDNNYCRSEKVAQDIAEHNPEDSVVYTTQDSYYFSVAVTSDLLNEDSAYNGSDNATFNIGEYISRNTTRYVVEYTSETLPSP